MRLIMKKMKVCFALVALGFGFYTSACTALDSELELYESCINGKGARYAIPTSRANQLPKWSPDSKAEPPLSIKNAVAIGARKTNQAPNNLFMIQMNKAFNTEVWYYHLDFLTPSKGRLPVDDSRKITLLMDGSAVEPQAVECR